MLSVKEFPRILDAHRGLNYTPECSIRVYPIKDSSASLRSLHGQKSYSLTPPWIYPKFGGVHFLRSRDNFGEAPLIATFGNNDVDL